MKTLYWIFPCYNEEECLVSSYKQIDESFQNLLKKDVISKDSKIIFVDDGSKDKTWEIISKFAKENKFVTGVKLSHNRGHQYAVEAGLQYAFEKNADFTITMDVDLQDDIKVIEEMINKHYDGNDVVYGVRTNRKTDSAFKRKTAKSYYKMMKRLGVELIEEAADFRLLSNRATKALLSYEESNLFLRGLVPQIGYPSACVEFSRLKRQQGKTHYPVSKMVKLAIDGMTSFSSKPLVAIGKLGIAVLCLSIIYLITIGVLHGVHVYEFNLLHYLFGFIAFNTGVILSCLGVLGLYLGKVNIEVKKRPHYFIEKTTDDEK